MSRRGNSRGKGKDKDKRKDGGSSVAPGTKVTRGDIESKLRELQGEVDEGIESARGLGVTVAIGGGILLVLLAYWFGRRRGKKRQTVLEIRRI